MTSFKKSASISFAAGAAAALMVYAGGVASARDVTVFASLPEDALSERVSYADLDLASQPGVRTLNLRVDGAVGRVCSPLDQRSTFSEHGACKSFAWNGARRQMDRAIERAGQLASTGTTSIAPVAILIAAPRR